MNTSLFPEEPEEYSPRGLIGLVVGMVVIGAVLYRLFGLPHLPARFPTWAEIVVTLQGSEPQLEALAYLFLMAAWVAWLYLAGSLVLYLFVAVSDGLTQGAAWAAGLRAAAGRVTLPIVREVVDHALVVILVVHLASRTVSTASAAPLVPPPVPALVVGHDTLATQQAAEEQRESSQADTVSYTVRRGDTLWSIAARFYGTGYEYPRLVEANLGRTMADGQRFTQAARIYPGWVLRVPLPSRAVEEVGGQVYYTIQPGDTLWGIAARLLGEEDRWKDLFEANVRVARLGEGRVLRDPDLIWPGLRLRLPIRPHQAEPQAHHNSLPESVAVAPEAQPQAPMSQVPASPEAARQPSALPPRPTPAAKAFPPSTAEEPALLYEAAALAAAAGGALLLARRRVRRSLAEPPVPLEAETPRLPPGEFAEAELTRAFTHRLQANQSPPVLIVADQVLRFLADHQVSQTGLLLARESRAQMTLTLIAGLLEGERILGLAKALGAQLGATTAAAFTSDQDVAVHLTGWKRTAWLDSAVQPHPDRLRLLPVGARRQGETLYANWPALGHVLVAGSPGSGTEVILASLLAALASAARPEELKLSVLAGRQTFPAALERLPHLAEPPIDPGDMARMRPALDRVEGELSRRMRHAAPKTPEWVLVLGELADVRDYAATLELIARQGLACGIRLVAATAHPLLVGDGLLGPFATRLVLELPDEEQSLRLLGDPEAADLGHADLLLRLDGRRPIRARGFCVSPEALSALLRRMEEAYGGHPSSASAGTAPATPPSDRGGDPDTTLPPHREIPASDPAPDRASHPLHPSPTGSEAASVNGKAATRDSSPSPGSLARAASRLDRGTGSIPAGADTPPGEQGLSAPAPSAHAGETPAPDAARPLPPAVVLSNASNGRVSPAANGAALPKEEPLLGMPDPAISSRLLSDRSAIWEETGPQVELCCFGGFTVCWGGRTVVPADAQGKARKPWEVLAFLAVQPGQAAPKDRLITALWPDVPPERASNRLRWAMGRLREVLQQQVPDLPPEAIRGERDGTCTLDRAWLVSDACRFLELCRAAPHLPVDQAKAAWQEARALYQGDLLTDHGAECFDWVDDHVRTGISLRQSYREEYFQATQQLAELYFGEGQVREAMALYRDVLKREPTLEDVVRKLCCCYEQLGDLHALLQEDQRLRQALQAAYADLDGADVDPELCEPEPETVALFQEIREKLQARGREGRVDLYRQARPEET